MEKDVGDRSCLYILCSYHFSKFKGTGIEGQAVSSINACEGQLRFSWC